VDARRKAGHDDAYRAITSAILWSLGFTITSLFCTIANRYGFNAATSLDAFVVTAAVVTLVGSAAPTLASNPAGVFC
jgi:hypothetical protein